jgi:hypothetical protein
MDTADALWMREIIERRRRGPRSQPTRPSVKGGRYRDLMPHLSPCWCKACIAVYVRSIHREKKGRSPSDWAPEPRPCKCCGWSWTPYRNSDAAQFCSAGCRNGRPPDSSRLFWPVCVDCGGALSPTGVHAPYRWCGRCSEIRSQATNRRKNAKRRGAKVTERYTLTDVGERDGWCCHLCGGRVDRRISGTKPRGPSIDHLIPIAAGGDDSMVNVALAHRVCNTGRRDRGAAQLRLIA